MAKLRYELQKPSRKWAFNQSRFIPMLTAILRTLPPVMWLCVWVATPLPKVIYKLIAYSPPHAKPAHKPLFPATVFSLKMQTLPSNVKLTA